MACKCDRCGGENFTRLSPNGSQRYRCNSCGQHMYFPGPKPDDDDGETVEEGDARYCRQPGAVDR